MGTEWATLRESAKLTGKSMDTLRRWVKARHVVSKRQGDGPSAVVLVDRASLLAYAAASAVPSRGGADSAGGYAARGATPSTVAALQAHLADVQSQRNELRRERDAAQAEVARLTAALEDKTRRVEALEREMAGGVRGLLGSARRRLGL